MKIFVCLASFALSSCLAICADTGKEESESAIKEAMFRYQFLHLTPKQQRVKAKFYALSFGDKVTAPNEAFLKRFATNSPPIKEGALVFSTADGIFAKGTNEPGLGFEVTKVDWLSATEVVVRAGHEETALRKSWHNYHLKKENGVWTVLQTP